MYTSSVMVPLKKKKELLTLIFLKVHLNEMVIVRMILTVPNFTIKLNVDIVKTSNL